MTYFVDTNVLVYTRDLTEPDKQQKAQYWLEHVWRERSGRLSYQVLQEYYVTVTQKLNPGLSRTDARDDIRTFQAWRPLAIDNKVTEHAWDVQDRYGFSWWDSLIVAASLQLDCEYLLTEDLQHGQRLDSLTVVSPFIDE